MADKIIRMRIEDSLVKLSSQYNASSSQKNIRITIVRPIIQRDTVDITSFKPINQNTKTEGVFAEYSENDFVTEKQRIARFLIEAMFGIRIPTHAFVRKSPENTASTQEGPSEQYEITDINFTERFEKEDVGISMQGTVTTSEGKTYNFNFSLRLNRTSYEADISINTHIQGKDPLVLNLSGIFSGLSDSTIDFDIDADGATDKIHFVKKGSGIVVIDENNDGRINDGGEVIGTKSGNAIAELALYDDDGNGWIDEADKIFARLSVWERDEAGNDTITTLKDKGIGAICLTSISTPFQIKGLDRPYGDILDSGIFLFENGDASHFHRVNLFV